jgi:general secretion pathway protein K
VSRHAAAPHGVRCAAQRGTALLLALIILALVATLAAAMVSRQQRALAVEAAERARSQSAWVLAGALDWARLILREDAREGTVDDLGEPWAVPLAEARLSTFLAADRDNNAPDPGEDAGPEAFLSGAVRDLQGRFNLQNVVGEETGEPDPRQIAALRRLCQALGLPDDVALRLAGGLVAALREDDPEAPLLPTRFAQLRWFGVDEAALARLEPHLTLLPQPTPVNINTASREVLAAVVPGLDLGGAERIVQRRARNPYKTPQELAAELGPALNDALDTLSTGSRYFEVVGRLRLDGRVFEERSIVERSGERAGEVATLLRERRSLPPESLP